MGDSTKVHIRIKQNPSPDDLEQAYAQGMLRKEALIDGYYYRGWCRNAKVARWDAASGAFQHVREKFGSRFLETIKHPQDELYFDVFIALEVTEPSEEERIEKYLAPLKDSN